MLARHGCRPEVIAVAWKIQCSICIELSRRSTDPQAFDLTAYDKKFREVILIDEFWVTLTDSLRVTIILILDEASRLAVTVPVQRATPSVSAEEVVDALEMHWVSWEARLERSGATRINRTWPKPPSAFAAFTAACQTSPRVRTITRWQSARGGSLGGRRYLCPCAGKCS